MTTSRLPPTGGSAGITDRPLALLHGFTQTSASWGRFTPHLRRALDAAGIDPMRPVMAVDAPGHGRRHDLHLDLVESAELVGAEVMAAVGPAVYLGYSMGGRLALHLALGHPDRVAGLVLIGATAGLDDPADRAARVDADEELARTIERDGVAAFLDRWLTQPLFAGLDPAPEDIEARRANSAAGLAASLRLCGTGAQEPLWERLGEIAVPTLVLAGEQDAKFIGIGERLTAAIPAAHMAVVAGAGHATHLEAPDATASLIAEWLAAPPGS